jgi:hypothetical protein
MKTADEHEEGISSTITILISEYLSIFSFRISLVTISLSLTICRLLYIKIKENQSLRRPIYTGSSTGISLDSFDSEGYLRPHTDYFFSYLYSFNYHFITYINCDNYFMVKKEKTT